MGHVEHAGRRYEIHEIYRLDVEAYCIELTDLSATPQACTARVMCKEGTTQLLVSAEPDMPVELIERIIAIARRRLPDWEKNWDTEWDRHFQQNRE